MRALRFLLRKEFMQILRDRTILGMLLVMPVIQLLVLANAVTFDVRNSRLYLVDQDHSSMSRDIASRMLASGRFTLAEASQSMDRANEAMLSGRANAILVIPDGFERDIVRLRRAPVQLVLNAEDGAAAGVTASYASTIFGNFAAEAGALVRPVTPTDDGSVDGVAPRRGVGSVEVRARRWYNPSLDYREFMVPGILVMLVTTVGTLLTAMNIVREKEAGTLEQLNVTPISKGAFIAAKLIPLWAFAMIDLSLGLLVARFVFRVPMLGSVTLVMVAATIYLLGALGIGLWISSIVETQQQAMFVTFALLLVYLLMSGLFTPIRAMPMWAQWIASLNPIAHFVTLMRSVLLKGATAADMSSHLLALSLISGAVLAVAVGKYHKRSD